MNLTVLMGRLTTDPQLRYTPSQHAVATFNLAVQRQRSKDQEQVTDFFPCIAWRKTAEFVNKYFKKGQRVLVSGHLQTRSYQDKESVRRWVTEVIVENTYFADAKTSGQSPDASEGYSELCSQSSFETSTDPSMNGGVPW